jgi:hypothetical protein
MEIAIPVIIAIGFLGFYGYFIYVVIRDTCIFNKVEAL